MLYFPITKALTRLGRCCSHPMQRSQFFLCYSMSRLNGPRCEKSCLQGFRQSETQTSLLSYRGYLENQNFSCSKFRDDTFQNPNNKGADQSARMRRLICTFVVCKSPKTGFLASRPTYVKLFAFSSAHLFPQCHKMTLKI